MRPFIPPLLDSHQLDTVEEDEETETSRETSPIPVSLVGEQCSSRLEQDSSSAEDYNISELWDEDDGEHAIEQVKQILHNTFSQNLFQSFS